MTCGYNMSCAGPGLHRKPKLHLASDPGVSAYYKSVRVEAKRKWDTIKNRYREAKRKAFLRAELQADIHESAEWRKHLKALYSNSSSLSVSDHAPEQRKAGQQVDFKTKRLDDVSQIQDLKRVKSMLTSSSSPSNSDESSERRCLQLMSTNPLCKMSHRHCNVYPEADQGSSRSSVSTE